MTDKYPSLRDLLKKHSGQFGIDSDKSVRAVDYNVFPSYHKVPRNSVDMPAVTGTTDIQVARRRSGTNASVLSTEVTIGDEWYAEDGVINTSNDDADTSDVWYVDIDAVSTTAPEDLSIRLTFRLP